MARRTTAPPGSDPDVARLAGALADPSRLAMLDALMDGDARSIGELARRAGVTAATASGHLRRLLDEHLVAAERSGREQRVRLASPRVASLLETMAEIASPAPTYTSAATTRARSLRFARTCYDHLAGALGVQVTQALLSREWLLAEHDTFTPAPALLAWLADHGHAVDDPSPSRRPLARACLDWSERTPHVAGRVGAAMATLFMDQRWVTRVRDSRALRVTDRGRAALAAELALSID